MAVSIVRTIILYLLIIFALRIMGKRQIGEMQPSELVVTILISELAAIPMQDMGKPMFSGLIPIAVLVALEILLSGILLKSHKLRILFEGSPSILVKKGILDEAELRRNHLTLPELMEGLRLQGYTDFSAIHYAILETNGQLSVLPYEKHKPAAAGIAGLTPEETGLPLTLVLDGHVEAANLKISGLDDSWLQKELNKRNINSVNEVFLLTRDELGRIYCQTKDSSV